MMRRALQRCALRRLCSSSAGSESTKVAVDPAIDPKSQIAWESPQKQPAFDHRAVYARIINEMTERKAQSRAKYRLPPPPKTDEGCFEVLSAADLRRPLGKGNLLLLASGPVMVVARSTRQEERLTVADAVGTVREIQLGHVEARLGTLLAPEIANSRKLFDKAGGRVVPEVHDLLAVELRQFYNRAATLSSEVQGKVGDLLRLIQRENEPRTMSFFDFAALVLRIDLSLVSTQLEYPRDYLEISTPRITPELIYAVRMALDHYTLANKHILEFSYLGSYALTILPRIVEARNLRLLTAPRITPPNDLQKFPRSQLEYCKDYALGNLSPSNPTSDGLALEIIRRHPHFAHQTLSRDSAAELVNRYGLLNERGPYLDKYAYHWMSDSPLKPVGNVSKDLFEKVRTVFDQPVYCIDSDTAHEIDDGISVCKIGDTLVVGVHIADPSSAFGVGLVPEILKRPSTVYLPTGPLFMMDPSISETFSLKPGAQRRALSVFTTYDLENGHRISTRLTHSLLTNVVAKTYASVDAHLLKASPTDDLAVLSDLAKKLEANRNSQGAFTLQHSGAPTVSVSNKGEVSLCRQLSPETSAATQLVTEMMVQANCAVAEYTKARNLPNVYRTQALEFWTSSERASFLAAVASKKPLGFKFMPNIPRARLSTGVAAHTALGVGAYCHFTSPLRRGQDILTHLSVAYHLASESAPFSHSKLGGMLPWIETAQLQVKTCQRIAQRFWTLKLLTSKIGQTTPATICGVFEDYCEVHLLEYGVRARGVFRGEVDQNLNVKISEVDAVGNRCIVST